MSEIRRLETGASQEAGFTLLEILVAMGIFVVGATTLIGVLGVGSNTRRETELRARSTFLHEELFRRVAEEHLSEHPLPFDWEVEEDLAIPAIPVTPVDDDLDLSYSVRFEVSEELPTLVAATLRIGWLADGEESGIRIRRLLARDVPLRERVRRRTENF
ncbi:MAG: prepilin-type N-terminal cleavage/methylation domain-containing protein [Planctomycetota bacterium]